MSSGQGAKELNSVGNNKATSNIGSQKKKRPRQRQRPRNKARVSNGTAADGEVITGATSAAICGSYIAPIVQTVAGTNDERQNTIKLAVENNQSQFEVISNRGTTKPSPTKAAVTPSKFPKEVLLQAEKSVEAVTSNLKPLAKVVNLSNNHQTNTLKLPICHSESKNRKDTKNQIPEKSTMKPVVATGAPSETVGKTREVVKAEREAKKLAKQAKKAKALGDVTPIPCTACVNTESLNSQPVKPIEIKTNASSGTSSLSEATYVSLSTTAALASTEKSREQIKAEREAKKQAKQAVKSAKKTVVPALTENLAAVSLANEESASTISEEKKKPVLSKAERRALQEAQRAAKAQALIQKSIPLKVASGTTLTKKASATVSDSTTHSNVTKSSNSPVKTTKLKDCKVKLFNHLESACQDVTLFVNNPHIHPSIARLGEQYAKRTIVGSNARCIAFLNALKMVIKDFETPPKKEFSRSMEATITICVDYLQKCRPLAVSVSNAYKHIKHMLTQLSTETPESDLKVNLCRFIDTYIENQIGKAAEAISYSMQEKISNGDVILTFGCSSLINYIFEEAQRRRVDFRVIVVDSRPFCEGQELLRRLAAKEIPCSYVLINAVSFVMPEATKVLLGAHALLANGYVMARTGTAQVALVAHSFNVPVLVCCETHKFSERFQTDAIVYNELGNPDDLILSDKCCLTNWQAKSKMSPLNLMYDITPPELVTAVVTEVSILPCTSVPVILRIKPTEIGYY